MSVCQMFLDILSGNKGVFHFVYTVIMAKENSKSPLSWTITSPLKDHYCKISACIKTNKGGC